MTVHRSPSPGSGSRRVIGSTLGPAPRFKPARDRAVPLRSVPCPVCKAEAGSPCVTSEGKQFAHGGHSPRRRMALRKLREEGEAS